MSHQSNTSVPFARLEPGDPFILLEADGTPTNAPGLEVGTATVFKKLDAPSHMSAVQPDGSIIGVRPTASVLKLVGL